MSEVQNILEAVKDQYGIRFSEAMTGGGCMALEARLETGHWIVATDEGLMGFKERISWEEDREIPAGWMIGVYVNNTEYGEDWWGGSEAIVDVSDYDGWAFELPDMIGKALAVLVDKL